MFSQKLLWINLFIFNIDSLVLGQINNVKFQHPYCKYPIHPCYFRLHPNEGRRNSFTSNVVKIKSNEVIKPLATRPAPEYTPQIDKSITANSFPLIQLPISALKGLPLKAGSRILIEFPAGFIKPGGKIPPLKLTPANSGSSFERHSSEQRRARIQIESNEFPRASIESSPGIFLNLPQTNPQAATFRLPEPVVNNVRQSALPQSVVNNVRQSALPQPAPRPVALPTPRAQPPVAFPQPVSIARTISVPQAPAQDTCPRANYKPCISKEAANHKAITCCRKLTQLNPQCHSLCSIDVTPSQMFASLQSGTCSQATIQPILTCLAQGRDLRPCCAAKGVTSGNRGICGAFCNPTGGIPRFSPRYLRCVPQWRNAVDCYWAHMNP